MNRDNLITVILIGQQQPQKLRGCCWMVGISAGQKCHPDWLMSSNRDVRSFHPAAIKDACGITGDGQLIYSHWRLPLQVPLYASPYPECIHYECLYTLARDESLMLQDDIVRNENPVKRWSVHGYLELICKRTEYMVVKCFNWICSWAPRRRRMCTILLLVLLACVLSDLGNHGRSEWGRNDEWRMTLLHLVVVLGRRSLRFLWGKTQCKGDTLSITVVIVAN